MHARPISQLNTKKNANEIRKIHTLSGKKVTRMKYFTAFSAKALFLIASLFKCTHSRLYYHTIFFHWCCERVQ
jgi:hypothetical protein